MHKVIAVIPCRQRSKRIPNKWQALVGTSPLWLYTYYAAARARNEGYVTEIVASSDCDDFLNVISALDPRVRCHKVGLIGDKQQLESQLTDLVMKDDGVEDVYICLQMTSPCRTASDIMRATMTYWRAKRLHGHQAGVVSGWQTSSLLWYYNWSQGYTIEPTYDVYDRPDKEERVTIRHPEVTNLKAYPMHYENGAIYVYSGKKLVDTGSRTSGSGIVPYIMPYERSYQVDVLEDIPKCYKSIVDHKIYIDLDTVLPYS